MKKISHIYYIIFIIILIGATIGYFYLKHIGVFNNNKLYVNVSKPLDEKLIKIYQGFLEHPSNNKISDLKSKHEVLIYNGKNIKTPITDHGENDFLITYNDSLYTTFRYLKTNNRMIDKFQLDFSRQNDSIFMKVIIIGTDYLEQRYLLGVE